MRATSMLNLILLVCFSAAFSTAQARTSVIFKKDGATATVWLNGLPGDPDAPALFETLAAPPQEEMGKLTKKVAFVDRDGARAFEVVCAFSKIVTTTGSCFIVLHSSSKGTVIDAKSRMTVYRALDSADAERLRQLFKTPETGGEIYRSSDKHLAIQVALGEDKKALDFVLAYSAAPLN